MWTIQISNSFLFFTGLPESVAILLFGAGLIASTIAARRFWHSSKREELDKTLDR